MDDDDFLGIKCEDSAGAGGEEFHDKWGIQETPVLLKHTLFSTLYIVVAGMADDTRDKPQYGEASTSVGSGLPAKKLPRSMVLGKDGKP